MSDSAKMFFELNPQNAILYTPDGHSFKFSDIKVFDGPDIKTKNCEVWGVLRSREISISCDIRCPFYFQNKIQKLAYGWYAKGPIRKRLVKRLLRQLAGSTT